MCVDPVLIVSGWCYQISAVLLTVDSLGVINAVFGHALSTVFMWSMLSIYGFWMQTQVFCDGTF